MDKTVTLRLWKYTSSPPSLVAHHLQGGVGAIQKGRDHLPHQFAHLLQRFLGARQQVAVEVFHHRRGFAKGAFYVGHLVAPRRHGGQTRTAFLFGGVKAGGTAGRSRRRRFGLCRRGLRRGHGGIQTVTLGGVITVARQLECPQLLHLVGATDFETVEGEVVLEPGQIENDKHPGAQLLRA